MWMFANIKICFFTIAETSFSILILIHAGDVVEGIATLLFATYYGTGFLKRESRANE